jgi:DNA-directed RNA polymerase subunit K/omega
MGSWPLQTPEALRSALVSIMATRAEQLIKGQPSLATLASHIIELVVNAITEIPEQQVSPPLLIPKEAITRLRNQVVQLDHRTLPDHIMVELLKALRDQRLIQCTIPHPRLLTPRHVLTFSPDKLLLWPSLDHLLNAACDTVWAKDPLPSTATSVEEIQKTLRQSAFLAILALILDGALVEDRWARPVSLLRLRHVDLVHNFVRTPKVRISSSRRIDDNETLSQPKPISALSAALLLSYLLKRHSYRHKTGEGFAICNPASFVFHGEIRESLRGFSGWISALVNKVQLTNSSRFSLSVAGKSKRPIICQLIEAARADLSLQLCPALITMLTGRIPCRSPLMRSWNRAILHRNQEAADSESEASHPQPSGTTSPTTSFRKTWADPLPTSSPSEEHAEKRVEIPRTIWDRLEQIHNAAWDVIKCIDKGSDRKAMASTIEGLAGTLPLLDRGTSVSPEAPLSNFRLILEWLVQLLRSRKRYRPDTVFGYFKSVRVNLIAATLENNILSMDHPDDVVEVVSKVIEGDHAHKTKKLLRSHCVSFFSVVHKQYPHVPEVDTGNSDIWLGEEWNEYPLLAPDETDRVIDGLDEPFTHAAVLASYGMCRRRELVALNLGNFFGSLHELRLYLRASKTASGRRSIPLFALLPHHYIERLLAYWEKRWNSISTTEDPFVAPFLVDRSGQRLTEDAIADQITDRLQAHLGKGHSLHTLRHAGASWFIIEWFCAIYGCPSTPLGFDLSHKLFTDEHLKQFRRLFLPEGDSHSPVGLQWSTDPVHALSRILGHATPRTSIETYIQSLPLLHYYFVTLRQHGGKAGMGLQSFARKQVQHLITSSSTKAWDLFKADHADGSLLQDQPDITESSTTRKPIPLDAVLSYLRNTYLKLRARTPRRHRKTGP